jgi:hypothetical protein
MGKRKKKQAKLYRAPFMPRPEDVEASGNDGDDAIPARQGLSIVFLSFNNRYCQIATTIA